MQNTYFKAYWNSAANGGSIPVHVPYSEIIEVIEGEDVDVPQSIKEGTASLDFIGSFLVENNLDSANFFIDYGNCQAHINIQELGNVAEFSVVDFF